MQSNIQDNHLENNIIQNKLAASNVCGYINLTDRLDSPCQNKIQISENYQSGNVFSDCITIDVYCYQKNIDFIHFVKIDVEGAELLVLQGAQTMLLNKKIGALLIEVIPQAVIDMGLSLEDLVNYINGMGYKCFKVNEDGTRGKSFSLEDMREFKLEENVLLLPSN